MSRSLRRACVAAVAALVTLLAAGCAGDEEPGPGSPTTTGTSVSATPSDAVVTWAGSVCSGADGLRAAVNEVAGAAPADVDASGSLSAQERAEVQARADAVRQAGQALDSTLRSPPPEAAATLATATADLAELSAGTQAQIDAMWTAAKTVASATTEADTKAALEALRSALLSAQTGVTAYAGELRVALADSGPAISSAFSAAPSCQEIPSS